MAVNTWHSIDMPQGPTSRQPIVLERRFVPKDAVIMTQGEQGDCAYLIQSGTVSIFVKDSEGHNVELAKMKTGDIFGEMALVFDTPRAATVKALEDCNLVVLTRQTFERKLEKSDPTVRAMLKMLSARILDINNTLMNKKSGVDDLVDATTTIYQNVKQSLPRNQQRTFQSAVLPKLQGFLDSVHTFRERYEEEQGGQKKD